LAKKLTLRDIPKHERVSELLRLFGNGAIDFDEFWAQMRQYGLTDEDIDMFCRGEHVE
jgi:hypothetical protein